MFPLGQDEGGADYAGGVAGAGGDVLEGGPAAGEQGKSAFSGGAQPAQEKVAGALVDVEFSVRGSLFLQGVLGGGVHADAGALVAGVGQAGQAEGRGAVESRQGMDAGGVDVGQ